MLLVVNYRPGHAAPWMRGGQYDQISLSPLRGPAADLLASRLLGGDGVRHAAVAADRRPGARQSIVHRGAGAQVRGKRAPRRRARRLSTVAAARHAHGARHGAGDHRGAHRQPARSREVGPADGCRDRPRVRRADPGARAGRAGGGAQSCSASPVERRAGLRKQCRRRDVRVPPSDGAGRGLPLDPVGTPPRPPRQHRRGAGEDPARSQRRAGGFHRLSLGGGRQRPAGGLLQHEGGDLAWHARPGPGARRLETRAPPADRPARSRERRNIRC